MYWRQIHDVLDFFFPIILAILFNLALGNIGSADNFKPINLAVVKNSSYEGEKEFTKVLDEVSDKKRDDVVFNTQYVSKIRLKNF